MSREKQIEEMAKDLCHKTTCTIKKDGDNCYKYCNAYIYAFRAINAGYCKQSEGEWIAKNPMIRSPLARNYYCSVCKYEPIEIKSYCPNCGAKMKGGE